MLDQDTRRMILKLFEAGQSRRSISRLLRVSRNTVREVLEGGSEELPERDSRSPLAAHKERIVEEVAACRGNLKRVQEELAMDGIEPGYSSLARFVKEHGLGKAPKPPTGSYDFAPGKESQFDTSPHDVNFKSGKVRCQCASIIFGYSRMLFVQYYPRFTRFEAKVFLTKALQYLGGACARCVVDNTNLVVLHGTGANAKITPEMDAFGKRFGFEFIAHELGDANRSGKVERPFHYLENNFLVKRCFADFEDLNRRVQVFCELNNHSFKRKLCSRPIDLYVTERPLLKPLPAFIPEVYELFHRVVDLAGYVNLHRNCYSAPWRLIGEQVEVKESLDKVRIYHRHREVAVHVRLPPKSGRRSTQGEHRPEHGARIYSRTVPQEETLRQVSETMDAYVSELKKHAPGRAAAPLKRLHRMYRDYPSEALERALSEALRYGLYDLERVERMVLRNIAGDYFPGAWLHGRKEDEDE